MTDKENGIRFRAKGVGFLQRLGERVMPRPPPPRIASPCTTFRSSLLLPFAPVTSAGLYVEGNPVLADRGLDRAAGLVHVQAVLLETAERLQRGELDKGRLDLRARERRRGKALRLRVCVWEADKTLEKKSNKHASKSQNPNQKPKYTTHGSSSR